jgi:predicted ATPase
MTRRYILTGTPGSGKTTILAALRDRGHRVVEEAATDIINAFRTRGVPEPWRRTDFIDQIIALQRQRQVAADAHAADDTIFDRSPVCTLALSVYLQRRVSAVLLAELDRIARANDWRATHHVRGIADVRTHSPRHVSEPRL